MENCLFCKVAGKELAASIVYEDETVLAFDDINPQAPVHTLVIPKRHITSLNEITEAAEGLAGHLLSVAQLIAQRKGIHISGYRTIINTNAEAGQSIDHLHLHVMGGRQMAWPPG